MRGPVQNTAASLAALIAAGSAIIALMNLGNNARARAIITYTYNANNNGCCQSELPHYNIYVHNIWCLLHEFVLILLCLPTLTGLYITRRCNNICCIPNLLLITTCNETSSSKIATIYTILFTNLCFGNFIPYKRVVVI